MVKIRTWGFTEDGKMFAYMSVEDKSEVYAMKDLSSNELRVKGSVSDVDKWCISKSFSILFNKYKSGKIKLGEETHAVWS